MNEKTKKISGKKITLIILTSLLAVLILAVGLFFGIASCSSKGKIPTDLKEGFTIRKPLPADGSTPLDHSGIDNIGYMAYVLDNQPFYHAYAHNSTKSTGYEQITQTWKDYQSSAENGTPNNVMVCSDLSYSSLVKASTQTCFVGDDNAYMRTGNKPSKNSVPTDITWSTDQPTYYNAEDYRKKYGEFSTELSVYVINEDTVESCGEVIDNGDGTYTQTFYLKEDAACWYRNGMKTRGSLKSVPDFERIEITFTFDGDWQVLSSYCEEKTKIAPSALGGVSMSSTSKTTTTFDYSKSSFDKAHFAQFDSYYKNYVGKVLDNGNTQSPEEPTFLDVLGNAFGSVIDAEGDGQQFSVDLTMGASRYAGEIYAKIGNMEDILGSLDLRVSLRSKVSDRQDLYIEFSDGELNLYYGNDFAALVDINEVADSVTKIINWVDSLGKVEAQAVAYALSGEEDATLTAGLDLDSLLEAIEFTYTEDSATISIVSDNLLGFGIGLDVKLYFDRIIEEDGSSAYLFRNLSLGSLSYNGTDIDLSASLVPDDSINKITRDPNSATINLADYINGVYGLLNSNTYIFDISLDGTADIEYINGLTLNATAQIAQSNAFNELTVCAPVSVKYGNLSLELEAYYTINLKDGSYGTVYLNVTNVSGQPTDAKVYCDISGVIDSVKAIIAYFGGSGAQPLTVAEAEDTQATENAQSADKIATIVNLVLGLDFGAIITDLRADNTSAGITLNVDEILKAFDLNLGFGFGELALTLANGEKATLSGTDETLGLTFKVSGSGEWIKTPELLQYADLNSLLNGVYALLNSETVEVKIELDGSGDLEYISGIILNATANLKLENGYNDISVYMPLSVSYNGLTAEANVYYTVNIESGSYGEVYLELISVNDSRFGYKIYCNISETINAVTELLELINSIGAEDGTELSTLTATANAASTDKIATVINAVINIDYASIIKSLSADNNGVSVTLNADELLKAFSLDIGIALGNISLGLGLDDNKTATLSGGLESLGLTLFVNGSQKALTAPSGDYLDVNDFISVVKIAAEHAKQIIESESVEFTVEDLSLTIDGIKMTVSGYGEASWKNDKIRFAANFGFAITENDNGETVEVVFVYDEASAPLVRFTVNGLGLEIYEEDIDEISELVNTIKNAVGGFAGGSGNTEGNAEEGSETTVTYLQNAASKSAINYSAILGIALDCVSNLTIELRDSEIEGAELKDIFIEYAQLGKLTLSANGGLAINLEITNANGTQIASFVAGVRNSTGENLNAINAKLDAAAFYESESFTREVYEYVLDLLDSLTVKNLLGSSTYEVNVYINGTDSGIDALNGITVNANLYYTEVENGDKISKLAEAEIYIDINGTVVEANAYIYDRTVYIQLNNVGGTYFTDIAFKAELDSIYSACETLVDVISGNVFAEIMGMFNGEPEAAEAVALDINGEEGKVALTEILNYLLTLDFNDVISYEKVDGVNTLTVNPDGILQAFGIDITVGTVTVKINPVTHGIEATADNGKQWLSFRAEAVELGNHTLFNPNDGKFVDINFVSALLDDLNKTLKQVEENSPEGEVLFSLKSGEGETITIDISSLKTITIDDVTITAGLKADNSFYFTFRGYLNASTFLFSTLTAERYITVTYSDGYITMGRNLTDSKSEMIYKVMTLEYLIDNLLDADNSPIRWLLGTSDSNWKLLTNVLNNIVKVSLDSGLTSTDELTLYYLYGGSADEDTEEGGSADEEKKVSLSDYLTGMSVKLGSDYESTYGDASSVLGTLGLGNATDYYAFDVNASKLVNIIKTLYAALLRGENGGLTGLYAYADIGGYVKVTANINGGLTDNHEPDYREIVNEKYKVNYENFAGLEYMTFGCYSSEKNTYEASEINRPYELQIYGYDGIENYTVNVRGGTDIFRTTLNSGSVVHLLDGEIWLDEAQTIKLIYVDEEGHELGNSIRLTSNMIIYQFAAGLNEVTFHSPYEDDYTGESHVGLILADPAVVESDGMSFAGWYLDENYTQPVFAMQVSATDYYARFVEKYYTEANGITYKFNKASNETSGYYVASSFNNTIADKDYTNPDNILYIADYINGFPVTEIANDTFNNVGLKKVIVSETVTTVGAQAFMDNKDMQLAVFLAPYVYFGGNDFTGSNRFVFYGTGTSANENLTVLEIYYNFATAEDNERWFGYKRVSNSDLRYIGNANSGGSRNGERYDANGVKISEGSQWSYAVYDISIEGADGVDLSALTSGIQNNAMTAEEIKAYVVNALNDTTKPYGYVYAYTVEVSGGYALDGKYYEIQIDIRGSLEPAWYKLSVTTNFNGNTVSVDIDGNYEVISISENLASYYVQAGAGLTLTANLGNEDYVFNGWNGVTAESNERIQVTMYSEATEISAVWQSSKHTAVTLVSEVAFTYDGTTFTDYDIEHNNGALTVDAEKGESLATPSADGYTFLGWAQLDENGTLVIAEGDDIVIGTSQATFYALWVYNRDDVTFKFVKESLTLTATVNEGREGSVYNWYGGADADFTGSKRGTDNDNSFTFTASNTSARVRLQYTLTVKFDASNTSWYYSKANSSDPQDITISSSLKGTVSNGTAISGSDFISDTTILEGSTVNVYRYWANGLVVQVIDGENFDTYLFKGRYNSGSFVPNYTWRELGYDGTHYIGLSSSWTVPEGLEQVTGEYSYYKSDNSDTVNDRQLFGTIELVNHNVSLTCKA